MEDVLGRSLSKKELKLELTVKQKDELKCAFDLLDESGVGTIDITDIGIALRALGLVSRPSDLSKIIRRYDPKNLGVLDFSGFLSVMTETMLSKYSDEEIKKAFQLYSLSDRGYLEIGDVKRVAQQLGEEISEEELQVS
uniref:EF-hand domain-containing protein n=1 Tax=Mesocestoides corti TaxID=53468 RepID=A0A5K3EZI5_MESCO